MLIPDTNLPVKGAAADDDVTVAETANGNRLDAAVVREDDLVWNAGDRELVKFSV